MQDTKIHHAEQLQKMLDAYDGPVTAAVDRWFPLHAYPDRDHIRLLLRQAIEQAFDAGHACGPGHS